MDPKILASLSKNQSGPAKSIYTKAKISIKGPTNLADSVSSYRRKKSSECLSANSASFDILNRESAGDVPSIQITPAIYISIIFLKSYISPWPVFFPLYPWDGGFRKPSMSPNASCLGTLDVITMVEGEI